MLPQSGELLEEAADGVSVVMEEMSLAYEGERWVLSGVTFRAEPGEIVALIGPSGGGKTTMIRTMLGLIAPGRGRAFLRGRDGREVAMNAALRGCFSYVPQGNTMISGTVAENLRMVAPSASDEELERALRAACAWEFVEQMPDGRKPSSVSAVTGSPRGRPSGLPSRGRCCGMRRCCVFEDGNGAGELVQTEDLVELHGLAGRDVVDDDPVLNRINKHNVSPPVSRCPAA